MATDPQLKPSFSPYRRWGSGLHLVFLVLVVLSIVVMVNYLSHDRFRRFHVSTRTKITLFPRTYSILKSITNEVKVTMYYTNDAPLYGTISDLLSEYRQTNPKISIQAVDYQNNPGGAQQLVAKYPFLNTASAKNLIIFDSGTKVRVVPGDVIAQYTLEQIPNPSDKQELLWHRKVIAFLGEMWFTGAILDVISSKAINAYYLEGHGEHPLESDERQGYLKFKGVLEQSAIQVQPLLLQGTNTVPADCSLLIIAGPRNSLLESELARIDQYLTQGGRLLALFNSANPDQETGLERVLAKWGIGVTTNVVVDPDHSERGVEVIVSGFSKHPLVSPLLGKGLYLLQPRMIGKLELHTQLADAPHVEPLAFGGANSFLRGDPAHKRFWPVMVAAEKGAIKDVVTERGSTRIVVTGDSSFLANQQLDVLGDRDFVHCATGWLLERTQLLGDIGPRPIQEYRIVMTRQQMQSAQWVLLAGMPGGMLFLGALVWLRRRR